MISKKRLILISVLIFLGNFYLVKINNVNNKISEEEIQLFSYFIYDNQDNSKIKVLATINCENGIEYIEDVATGDTIYGNGRTKIQIDYLMAEGETKKLNIKEKDKESIEKIIEINNNSLDSSLLVEKIAEYTGYKTLRIKNNINIEGAKTYYQIGVNGKWIEGSGKISISDYDVKTSQLLNDDNTVTITAKTVDSNGNIVLNHKNYDIDVNATLQSINADSLLDAIEKLELATGVFKIAVKDEVYNLRIYDFQEDLKIEANTQFGTEEDVGASGEYAKNMIVLKVEGDLTIDNNTLLTAYASSSGYGGPKGMMIYCTGTLTNNGTISMTARGAYAEGQDVYLWKNADGSYEYVPANGASGGASVKTWDTAGKKGENGINRATGGGGSGASYYGSSYGSTSGKGASGTSYSGGTGGGGAAGGGVIRATAGSENGR